MGLSQIKVGWRRLIGILLLVTGCSLFVQGCATRGGSVPYDRTDFAAPDRAIVAQPSNGKVGPLDTLSISVLQLPDLSRDFQVDAGGILTLPLLGAIRAVGLTPQELATQISGQLASRYVRNPDVSVTLKQSAAATITVEGAVQQPGVYPINGDMTLIKAVALARGTTDSANPRRVVVFRMINGQRNAAAFDLLAARRAQAPDPTIYGNDIVVVDGSGLRSGYKDLVSSIPLLALFRPF